MSRSVVDLTGGILSFIVFLKSDQVWLQSGRPKKHICDEGIILSNTVQAGVYYPVQHSSDNITSSWRLS